MDNQIIIRELTASQDIAKFWVKLYEHFRQNVFPDAGSEDLSYFVGPKYRSAIENLHDRKTDPLHYIFFQRNGTDIGLTMTVTYSNEDGKCFILEFCVFPQFRGNGTGRACAAALLTWAQERGASYFALNADTNQRQRFWGYSGFQISGEDENGLPLLIYRPEN